MLDRFQLALDVHCQTGESPVWLPDSQRLLFVDIPGRRIYRFDPVSGTVETVAVEEDIGCIAPSRGGGFVAGLRSGVWLLEESGARVRQLAANPEDTRTSRFNDGRVDPRGRFLAGTLDEPKAGGQAGLYRYDRRGLVRLADGLMTSNGLAFSPDGRTLYHSDTPRFVVYRYDYDPDSGEAVNHRVFVRLEPTQTDRGRPDGAAVDTEGCYWTSLYEGARIQRYDPDGHLMAEYPVPARNPTMPAFGGPDLKTLFVTTARNKADGSGGGVYAMRVEVPGLPTTAFDPEV
jgi:sugar lactone lactonase YvrE